MSYGEPARTAASRTPSLTSSPSAAASTTEITIYGCDQDEAISFREMAPRFGVLPNITEAAVSEANIELAYGKRCISIGHKTRVTNPTLLALSRADVKYVATRSIGCNHIDVKYAESVGISVGNVSSGGIVRHKSWMHTHGGHQRGPSPRRPRVLPTARLHRPDSEVIPVPTRSQRDQPS